MHWDDSGRGHGASLRDMRTLRCHRGSMNINHHWAGAHSIPSNPRKIQLGGAGCFFLEAPGTPECWWEEFNLKEQECDERDLGVTSFPPRCSSSSSVQSWSRESGIQIIPRGPFPVLGMWAARSFQMSFVNSGYYL